MIYGSDKTGGPMPANQECGVVPCRERDVPNRLGQLNNWAAEVMTNASELLKKIDPVLSNHPRPANPDGSEKCSIAPCGLATSLDSTISQLRNVAGMLKDACDRCEL